MKTTIFVLLMLGAIVTVTLADEAPIIDEEMSFVEKEIEEKKIEQCSEIKNIYQKLKCVKAIVQEARKEGKIRGTEEYCQKNYESMSYEDLEGLYKSLIGSQKTARNAIDLMEDENRMMGEVSKEDLQTEIEWVETKLARMQRERIKKKENDLFK